ncbi:D-2-hydroxyacid dehydrogenase [candidate division KSB1 bacterium]|nr:D-2-hydroxyacid dehydrogenase [candidate division KSB1 bacterium]
MNIVVLDGYTLNPGDLNWDELIKLGECKIYDRTSPEEIIDRSREADILLLNKVKLPREKIEKLPNLKYIGVLATGFNIVDIDAANEKKIPVSNVPTYGTLSVAQTTFAHLLNLTQRTEYHAHTVSYGKWSMSKDFCYWDFPLIELAGLTMGIIGFGEIGRAVAKIARAFEMNVIFYDITKQPDIPEGIIQINDPDDIFSKSDVVTLHCPLTDETNQIVNTQRLKLMKKSAYLINTSRGQLVDEEALADALNSGQIAGAGLDVLSEEPPKYDNILLSTPNCFITPHIAWATRSARQRLMDTVIANIKSFQQNKPQNIVNNWSSE